VSGHVPPPTAADNYLTAAKRRVADLWPASSLTATNARVAVELFTGQRTFEAHLSWAYRKLVVLSPRADRIVPAAGIARSATGPRWHPVRKHARFTDSSGHRPQVRSHRGSARRTSGQPCIS
jgi:hypothetical protein